MKPDLKIVRPPQPPGHRAALRAAIASAEKSRGKLNETLAAVRRSVEIVAAAQARLDRATADVEASLTSNAQRLADAAISGKSAPANTAGRQLRLAEAEAQDELSAAQMALGNLKNMLAAAEHEANLADPAVEEAAKAVMSGEVERILAESIDLHEKLSARRMALHFLQKFALSDDQAGLWHRVNSHLGRAFDEANWREHPVVKQWRGAHEALTTNADAELPK